METLRKYYRVDRREISFVKFIFEAYEGLAVVSNVDRDLGVVMFSIAPGCEKEFNGVLRGLRESILMEEMGKWLKAVE